MAIVLVALGDFLLTRGNGEEGAAGKASVSWISILKEKAGQEILDVWLPAFAYADNGAGDWLETFGEKQLSPFAYGEENGGNEGLQTESGSTYEKILLQEGASEDMESERGEALEIPEVSEGKLRLDEEAQKRLQEENQTGTSQNGVSQNGMADGARDGNAPVGEGQGENASPQADSFGFVKAQVPSQEYDWSYYQDFDALIKEFYAVDATTEASPERLNLENLLERDMTIQKNPDVPQILIYHTHSQETFVDSVPGDASTSIVGAGELLAQILREEYGYNVIHHTGEFDVESRDNAYSNSLPAITQILEENPTIEVVIDLHRDAVLEGRKLVTELNGKPTATFMFFNGLSYTREVGNIDYLENPYINENLAFSFQMEVIANEYYPGLTRRIYLKGYRYNMHLRPRSLLIELGAQTNTVEEIMNACAPIAHILDLELTGAGL